MSIYIVHYRTVPLMHSVRAGELLTHSCHCHESSKTWY